MLNYHNQNFEMKSKSIFQVTPFSLKDVVMILAFIIHNVYNFHWPSNMSGFDYKRDTKFTNCRILLHRK